MCLINYEQTVLACKLRLFLPCCKITNQTKTNNVLSVYSGMWFFFIRRILAMTRKLYSKIGYFLIINVALCSSRSMTTMSSRMSSWLCWGELKSLSSVFLADWCAIENVPYFTLHTLTGRKVSKGMEVWVFCNCWGIEWDDFCLKRNS